MAHSSVRGQPLTENLRLFRLAAPTRAILARQRKHHRLMLPGAVAEAFKVVVEPVDLLHRLARRFDGAERQDVPKEARIDVLLARRRRVEIKIAIEVSSLL